jgi:ubiquitin-like protein Pup
LNARITKLKQQREQIHSSLGKLLENASDYAKNALPELILALDRVLEQTNALLVQIGLEKDELDDQLETNAEEFVKNYVVKPGFRGDSGGILRTQGAELLLQVIDPI